MAPGPKPLEALIGEVNMYPSTTGIMGIPVEEIIFISIDQKP